MLDAPVSDLRPDVDGTAQQDDAVSVDRPVSSVDAEPLVRRSDVMEYRAAVGAFTSGQWDEDRWRTFRLRHGVYVERDPGKHMVRVKVPGGRLDLAQARGLVDVARNITNGVIHLTTRQDVQLYGVDLNGTADTIDGLNQHGLTTRESSGATFRNVTSCPLAGVCPREHVDAADVADRLTLSWLRNPLVQHMPRKFKAAVSGCEADCGATAIDDLGFIATRKDGQPGFKVVAGGGLGARPRLATVLLDFVVEGDLPAVQEALARLHHVHSARGNRNASRLKFLFNRLGEEKFAELFQEAFTRAKTLPQRPWEPLQWNEQPSEQTAREIPQLPGGRVDAIDGSVALVVRPRLGSVSADELERLTALLAAAGLTQLRITRDQNLVIPGVAANLVDDFAANLAAIGLPVVEQADGSTNITSCPGTSTCPIGITNSNALSGALLDDVELAKLPETRIRISGCQNSCGHHHVADFGLHGIAKKIDGRSAPHYQVHLGGSIDAPDGIGIAGPFVPAAQVADVLKTLIRTYDESGSQSVRAWAEGLGRNGVKALVDPILAKDLGVAANAEPGTEIAFVPPASSSSAGECAAPAVVAEYLEDLARAGWQDLKRFVAIGDFEAGREAGREGLVAAAQRLLAVAQIDVPNDHDALWASVRETYSAELGIAEGLGAVLASEAVATDRDRVEAFGHTLIAWIDATTVVIDKRTAGIVIDPVEQSFSPEQRLEHLRELAGDATDVELLRKVIGAKGAGRIAVMSSFGAETAAVLHLVASIDPSTEVLFLNTQRHFPETLRYRDKLVSALGLTNLREISADEIVVDEQDPLGQLAYKDPDACCALRKTQPLDLARENIDVLITGRKRFHGGERGQLDTLELIDGTVRVNPLAQWSPEDVDALMENENLPRHPMVEDGFLSVGCMPCTERVAEGGGVRDGRWVRQEKTECGIHVASGRR